MTIIPVLLAGGAGTRLWPVSRDAFPKQFLPLLGQHSTYQDALLRLRGPQFAPPIVITGPEFHFLARRQAEEIGVEATIVVEPMRRDSAPAIAAGALVARGRDPNALVLTAAADHVITDKEAFLSSCLAASPAAQIGSLVAFGMRPTEPKSSYGYILPGEPIAGTQAKTIERFVEKPDPTTAARCLLEGYLWNSGNFLFRSDVLLSEVAKFEPEMAQSVEEAVLRASEDLSFLCLHPDTFAHAPQKSIDYAVMERTDRAAVVRGDFGWSDIGSWDALYDLGPRDGTGNVLHGNVITLDSRDCVVHSEDALTAILGVNDLVVVRTPDAVLVMPRARSQDVRHLVTKLKENKQSEASLHRRVHRPWGYYESLDAGDRFQVKRIVVVPGGVLSLQKHRHRAEHWVVVRGTAEVTVDDQVSTVHENESIYIPMGRIHRLANHGRIPLDLIEVQTGSYLGEDDIVRLEDVYKRA